MRYFNYLHPICGMFYFVSVIALTLLCMHPLSAFLSFAGAFLFLSWMKGVKNAAGWLKFILPMAILITIVNPLFNHRGMTLLFKAFEQWITLEAVLYGVTAGVSLGALILWCACYQEVMTSDKFLYLFGKAAPATALLISMTIGLVPRLSRQFKEIQESTKMLNPEPKTFRKKMQISLHEVSALLGWSVENAVEQADAMKARGYGLGRRTNFHLFHFESTDAVFLVGAVVLAGTCLIARFFGFGTMEFYPQMVSPGGEGRVLFFLFETILMLLPVALEGKEAVRWRSLE